MSILTNREVSLYYKNQKFSLTNNDFISSFAYWVAMQGNDKTEIQKAVNSFRKYISENVFIHESSLHINDIFIDEFTYDQVEKIVSETEFEKIPEIMALNQTKPDFIDLCALSRNVFHMILREYLVDELNYNEIIQLNRDRKLNNLGI